MPERPVGGAFEGPRGTRPDEVDAMLATVNRIHRLEKGRPPSVAQDFPPIYAPENLDNVLIIKDGPTVVSSVGIWVNEVDLGAARLRVGGINCLATLPEYRRHGLGARIMEAAHERMRALGCHVGLLGTLIVNWYRRLGWEHAGVSRSYRFDRGNIGLLPPVAQGLEIRQRGPEAAEAALSLRKADRLGGVRSAAVFRSWLSARGNPPLVFAERGGTPIAYILPRGRTIIEWAGPGETVAALTRRWYEQTDDPTASTSAREGGQPVLQDQLTFVAPGGGHAVLELLDRLRIPYSIGYAGMLYLLRPGEILAAFGLADVRVREVGEGFALERNRERVLLTRCLATKHFFGPERVCDFAEDIIPLPFWQWPLEHV